MNSFIFSILIVIHFLDRYIQVWKIRIESQVESQAMQSNGERRDKD